VDCYVIKTRWDWMMVQEDLGAINGDYHAVYSIKAQQFRDHIKKTDVKAHGEVKGVFHYMVLAHDDYKLVVHKRSSLYQNLVRKNHRVYVESDSVVKPFKPRYADKLTMPIVHMTAQPGTFAVDPPYVRPPTPPRTAPKRDRAPSPPPNRSKSSSDSSSGSSGELPLHTVSRSHVRPRTPPGLRAHANLSD
jgi:hypothetical protein